jgi:hypothetical protein
MKADTDAAIDAFGKNEQVKKVFWALFVAMAGLVLARVLDPATAQQIVSINFNSTSGVANISNINCTPVFSCEKSTNCFDISN